MTSRPWMAGERGRTDLETTQSDLKRHAASLTLIARNHEDVEQLRRLGEREYIEFTH